MCCASSQVYNNGRFEMRPGLSRPGDAYRFERPNGAIFSFRLENASAPPPAPDDARRVKLLGSAAQALARSRRAAVGGDFAPPPGPAKGALRVTLFGEIVAAKGFTYDNLYVEWSLTCVGRCGGGDDALHPNNALLIFSVWRCSGSTPCANGRATKGRLFYLRPPCRHDETYWSVEGATNGVTHVAKARAAPLSAISCASAPHLRIRRRCSAAAAPSAAGLKRSALCCG